MEPPLLGPLVGIEPRAALRNADLLGRLMDTFVLAQIRPELESSEVSPTLYHLRQEHGRHEVDLLAEAPGGGGVAFEVKASSAPDRGAAAHLCWLRDQLRRDFVAGVVFHTGPNAFQLEERVYALPIAALWAGGWLG